MELDPTRDAEGGRYRLDLGLVAAVEHDLDRVRALYDAVGPVRSFPEDLRAFTQGGRT